MPDTRTLDITLSGTNPDLQSPLDSGKLTHHSQIMLIEIGSKIFETIRAIRVPSGATSANPRSPLNYPAEL